MEIENHPEQFSLSSAWASSAVSVKARNRWRYPSTDCPDVGERQIDGHACFSGLSLDTTERDDILTRGNELFGDKMNVKAR